MAKNHIQISGLTMIELLIALAIAAILFAAAAPRFTTSIQNNRMVAQINELHASLSLGRSEAVKRNGNTTICRSSSGTDCTGNWQDGWIVFVDDNADGTFDVGDEILRVHGAISGDNTLTFSQTRVIYTSSGLATAGIGGTFTLCDARGATSAKGLIVGLSGRPRLATGSDADPVCS